MTSTVRRLNAAQELVRQELFEVSFLTNILSDLSILDTSITSLSSGSRVQSPACIHSATEHLPVATVVSIPDRSVPELPEVSDTLLNSEFRVGDRVRVLNPRPGQPREGVIIGVGRRFINVLGPRSISTSREPKNLRRLATSNITR